MEEKERYEIHIYDDVCVDLYNNGVLDKSINDTYKLEKLLNQQDKELSKLRASYQQVKEENQQLIKALNGEVFINYKLPMENAKLKQQLAESEKERELDNSFWKQECDSLQKTLAEKDAELLKWSTQYARAYVNRQNALIAENEQLKQQLEEKDKEIDNLYDRLNSKQKFYEMSLEKDYKEYLSRLNKLEKQCDKDKISFTIQQLEKVKELLLEKCGETYSKTYCGIDEDIEEIIGNQIKQLKELR